MNEMTLHLLVSRMGDHDMGMFRGVKRMRSGREVEIVVGEIR